MSKVYFISHPEVEIDFSVPVSEWGLSVVGKARAEKMLEQPWVSGLGAVFSSKENKAVQTAEFLSKRLGLDFEQVEDLGEMDRSSTGALPKEEFEAVVNEAFAKPLESIRGWEKLAGAQERILNATKQVLGRVSTEQDVAIVSHGGVGTLLICQLKGTPISRVEDQPGQGHYFVFERDSMQLLQGWERIDEG